MTTDSKESGPRRHDVTVRRIRRDTVVGYRQLLEDLERIRNWSKKSPKNKTPRGGRSAGVVRLSGCQYQKRERASSGDSDVAR
jgi:hypothetical protein